MAESAVSHFSRYPSMDTNIFSKARFVPQSPFMQKINFHHNNKILPYKRQSTHDCKNDTIPEIRKNFSESSEIRKNVFGQSVPASPTQLYVFLNQRLPPSNAVTSPCLLSRPLSSKAGTALFRSWPNCAAISRNSPTGTRRRS